LKCGLPFSLSEVGKKLNIISKKLETGKALIKYFSCPVKPTKTNGFRVRNYPENAPEKWEEYKSYNIGDVEAEREIYFTLLEYEVPKFEQDMYQLDQTINDRGILVDLDFAAKAVKIESEYTEQITKRVVHLTGLDNPNSPLQLKKWLFAMTGHEVTSLTKETYPVLLKHFEKNKTVVEVIESKQKLGKTSVKKYTSMLYCACEDCRVRGLFQFYGANRTGRWAGRLVQLQNLPQNHIKNLDLARQQVFNSDCDTIELLYDDVATILSELIRTAFIPKLNNIFIVADFSAIEARVVSWLADEEWRLEVFRTHGKIYEAAASRMFNVPIEVVTKDSHLRAKAKNGELALGYQGSLGAMKRMGGEKMGLSDGEMMSIVNKWRKANPRIVALWDEINECAIQSVLYNNDVVSSIKGITFKCDGVYFMIVLPSGHTLYYRNPRISINKFKSKCITYEGIIQETKQWGTVETYGGKLVENIVQAISRDILGYSMQQLEMQNYPVVMHVHDEAICEIEDVDSDIHLKNMCDIMGQEIPWAKGLPLRAEGFKTTFYKKD